MLVGVAVLTVAVPRQVGGVIDGLVAGRLVGDLLWREVLILIAMGVAIYFLRVGWRLQLFAAAYRLGVELRANLYRRLTQQGPPFFQTQRTGDLMARATNDVDAVEMAAGEAFLAAFDGTLTLVLVVAMMTLGIDWRLGLVALLPFPLMAIAFWVISRRVHEAWADSLQRFSHLNEHVQESVAGVRTLRALGLEAHAGRDFARRTQAAADSSFTAQKWESAYEPAVGLTLTSATVLTLSVGGWLVWRNELTIGQLTAFTMYLGQLIWPMFAAGWVLSLIERGRAAWARLDPVLTAPLTVQDNGHVVTPPAGSIHFDRVSFAYASVRRADDSDTESSAAAPVPRPDAAFNLASAPPVMDDVPPDAGTDADGGPVPALTDVSFTLAPGRTLGVVGPTGAGKTTLLALLLRHYAPLSGQINWGAHALPDYTLASLRSAMAWVPQEAFLFSATIAENIALARPDASRAQVEEAARLAALHDDVLRFPQGYETRVGEKGVTLSGGQRQRVAIARALLADATDPTAAPPLLLLDDALSAVDTGTETRILAHLRGARRGQGGRSAVIVSHRLSAVADADLILVLKRGRMAERGTHDELLALGGWYAAQWRYQQLEASLDADAAGPGAPVAG